LYSLDTDQKYKELEGTLDHIVYSNSSNGWSVIKLISRGKKITAVGNLAGVQPGEHLKLKGKWVHNPVYGPQFQVSRFSSLRPATLEGIEKYLSSGMIRGIGREMAKRLVASFGEGVLDMIEKHPERLTQVDGIGPVRAERIVKAWEKQKDIRDVMILLQSYGVSSAYAPRIYKAYGKDTIGILHNNPYRLAMDIYGIGFKTADKIASSMGISKQSPKRAKAGVLYVLGQLSDKGHVYFPYEDLVNITSEDLNIDKDIIENALKELSKESLVVMRKIANSSAVYLPSIYASESGVINRLSLIMKTAIKHVAIDTDKAMEWFESRHGITLADKQREAVSSAINSKVVIITGGPGTGKTTLIRAIIEILEKKGIRILLCAPTGRAAKRLGQATGRNAKTIHRLLEFNPSEMQFDRNQKRPLKLDMLIIDEFSMVDIVLFYNVLKALPNQARLILVGDVDQLPSVGPGNVLKDMIGSGKIKTVKLERIFRQARKSLIIVNAHRVNKGEIPYLSSRHGKRDFFFVKRESPEEILETVKEFVSSRIPGRFGFDPIDDIQVLAPMHKGLVGVSNLNNHLQALLNPSRNGIKRASNEFKLGDKVMQLRNNYELGVFNGDVGRISSIRQAKDDVEVRVDFYGRQVCYNLQNLDELSLAYACSVHKSQGNEFPAVVIALHSQHYIMLKRNLLYTAITRGKRLVVIVGNFKAIAMAVNNIKENERYTSLRQRLREETLL